MSNIFWMQPNHNKLFKNTTKAQQIAEMIYEYMIWIANLILLHFMKGVIELYMCKISLYFSYH